MSAKCYFSPHFWTSKNSTTVLILISAAINSRRQTNVCALVSAGCKSWSQSSAESWSQTSKIIYCRRPKYSSNFVNHDHVLKIKLMFETECSIFNRGDDLASKWRNRNRVDIWYRARSFTQLFEVRRHFSLHFILTCCNKIMTQRCCKFVRHPRPIWRRANQIAWNRELLHL